MTDEGTVRAALLALRDTDGAPLLKPQQISGIDVRGPLAGCVLDITPDQRLRAKPLQDAAEAALITIQGIEKAQVILTAHGAPPTESPKPASTKRPSATGKIPLPGIKKIVAVASGKGGVGKSTVAVNLAAALTQQGLRVGLLDADIYGPSLPRMMGIEGEKPPYLGDKKMAPIQRFNISCMSIGFMVDPGKPVIWRGPMVMGAIEQMLRDVVWGELDILLIDLPPGTGDAQLTLAQRVPLTSAVIVSTPQDIALLDARKGLAMFQQMQVPIAGIIENMSFFCCPACGHREPIFDHGGAEEEARRLNVPFLGAIPLERAIREHADTGTPIALTNDPAARYYRDIAGKLQIAV